MTPSPFSIGFLPEPAAADSSIRILRALKPQYQGAQERHPREGAHRTGEWGGCR